MKATNIQTQAARSTDPETSHMAAEEVTKSGKRETHIKILTDVVNDNPGMTSKEIAFMLQDKYPELDRHEVARRLADAKGCSLQQGTVRKCRLAKRMCVTWWPIRVQSMPVQKTEAA